MSCAHVLLGHCPHSYCPAVFAHLLWRAHFLPFFSNSLSPRLCSCDTQPCGCFLTEVQLLVPVPACSEIAGLKRVASGKPCQFALVFVYHLCGWWQQKGCRLSCFLGLVVGDLGTPRFLFLPWRPFIPPLPEGSVAVSHTRLVSVSSSQPVEVVFHSTGPAAHFPCTRELVTVEIICLLKAGPTTVRRASQH